MKLRVGVFALSSLLLFAAGTAVGQSGKTVQINGVWEGTATVRGGAHVPVTLRITGAGSALQLSLLNGPAAHPEVARASSVRFDGTHLVANYDSIGRGLVATLSGGTLSGTYGPLSPGASHGVTTPFTAARVDRLADPAAAPNAPDLHGAWEISTKDSKGSTSWELRIAPVSAGSPVVQAVIQRVDGDTGSLFGVWDGARYLFSHYNDSGAALYSVTPRSDGTLMVKNLIEPTPMPAHAGAAPKVAAVSAPSEYIARRADNAGGLAASDAAGQTRVKDPSVPFAFSFPDLKVKVVSNTDPQFRGKVVIVASGGAWCPNCHDEAPFLVESLQAVSRARTGDRGPGLRGRRSAERPGPTAGIHQASTAFTYHRAGRRRDGAGEGKASAGGEPGLRGRRRSFWGGMGVVREVHAGFAGPANPPGHAALVREVTELVEQLLAEPAPTSLGTVW